MLLMPEVANLDILCLGLTAQAGLAIASVVGSLLPKKDRPELKAANNAQKDVVAALEEEKLAKIMDTIFELTHTRPALEGGTEISGKPSVSLGDLASNKVAQKQALASITQNNLQHKQQKKGFWGTVAGLAGIASKFV